MRITHTLLVHLLSTSFALAQPSATPPATPTAPATNPPPATSAFPDREPPASTLANPFPAFPSPTIPSLIQTIAIGSCIKEDQPAPTLLLAANSKPDLFIFLGDNIYGDSIVMDDFIKDYTLLADQPGLKALRENKTLVLATWDDHDFGDNDLGREYPKKRDTQKLFCDFWGEPADSPRRKQRGIFASQTFGPQGQRVQIILLDTRYNRSPLLHRDRSMRKAVDDAGFPGGYLPHQPNHDQQILGEDQWKWLEAQLQTPADIRLICSSIQFVSEEHRFESWANYPRERTRMIQLLNATKASGVIFLSGDRHWSEISALAPGKLTTFPPTFENPTPAFDPNIQPAYTLYDFTSSALNRPRRGALKENNIHRLPHPNSPYGPANFGLITINWNANPSPTITLETRDDKNTPVFAQTINLADLQTSR